jgi:hypothetical protein
MKRANKSQHTQRCNGVRQYGNPSIAPSESNWMQSRVAEPVSMPAPRLTTMGHCFQSREETRCAGIPRWVHSPRPWGTRTGTPIQDDGVKKILSTSPQSYAHIPLPNWMLGYRKEWLWPDITAGLTTAAVVIPIAVAYHDYCRAACAGGIVHGLSPNLGVAKGAVKGALSDAGSFKEVNERCIITTWLKM